MTIEYRVYGIDGHRQAKSFSGSCEIPGDARGAVIEMCCADRTGTNDYVLVRITGRTAADIDDALWDQIAEGFFADSRVGRIETDQDGETRTIADLGKTPLSMRRANRAPVYHGAEIIHAYTEACLDFAKQTRRWGELNDNFYYVQSGSTWTESRDGNGTVDLDVSWAFHQKAADIRKRAPGELVELLLDAMRDLDCDAVAGFSDCVRHMSP